MEQSDLFHWDFRERFSGYDAARLIVGIDPASHEKSDKRYSVVYERMEKDFERARFGFWCEISEVAPLAMPRRQGEGRLASVLMDQWVAMYQRGHETDVEEWLQNAKGSFEDQEFTRIAIQNWLDQICLTSKYRFIQSGSDVRPPNLIADEASMSTKEENTLLAIIATLCGAANVDYSKREAVKVILNQADLMGIKLSENTIKNKLALIPRAMESRGK